MNQERLTILISEQFSIDAASIGLDSSFEDLGIDSLDLAEMAFVIEDEFGVKLPEDEAKSVRTIRDTLDLISSRTAGVGA